MPQSCQPKVTNLNNALTSNQNISRLQIAVEHEVRVKKVHSAEKLVKKAAKCGRWNRSSSSLRMVMDDLLEIIREGMTRRRNVSRTRKSCSAYSKTI